MCIPQFALAGDRLAQLIARSAGKTADIQVRSRVVYQGLVFSF
jgi:hypothetical protein